GRFIMRKLLTLAVFLLSSVPLLAAEGLAVARAKVVAPFLDAQTIAVARVDPEALAKRLAALAKIDEAVLVKDAKALADFKKRFTDAGGKEIYVVISLAD